MSDIFRKVYKPISEEKSQLILSIKEAAEIVYDLMSKINSREMSLAKTHLEQATMWSTKAIVIDGEK
jgi:hypothetical protein